MDVDVSPNIIVNRPCEIVARYASGPDHAVLTAIERPLAGRSFSVLSLLYAAARALAKVAMLSDTSISAFEHTDASLAPGDQR